MALTLDQLVEKYNNLIMTEEDLKESGYTMLQVVGHVNAKSRLSQVKKKTQVFSTASDNKPAESILVYQGEREMAKDLKIL